MRKVYFCVHSLSPEHPFKMADEEDYLLLLALVVTLRRRRRQKRRNVKPKRFGFEKSFAIAKDVGNFTTLYGNFDLVIVSCTSSEVHLLVFRFLQDQIINLYPVYLTRIYLLQIFENQIRM